MLGRLIMLMLHNIGRDDNCSGPFLVVVGRYQQSQSNRLGPATTLLFMPRFTPAVYSGRDLPTIGSLHRRGALSLAHHDWTRVHRERVETPQKS